MNRENDCLLNENTLSQSLALMSLSCPANLKWNTSIHKDFRNFTDEHFILLAKRGKNALLPCCIFDHYYSIQFLIFLSPSLPVFLSRGSFDSKIENYAQCIYLFLWFNNRQKEWHRGNTVNLMEKNNVILFDSLPNANRIYSTADWHTS